MKINACYLNPPLKLICAGFLAIALQTQAQEIIPAHTILLEAEAFEQPGGWVNDSQFVDQMGSPFLLAHGLGRPVEDASTAVQIEKPGKHRVWVRSRDWAATWTKGKVEAPGKFQLIIAGKPVDKVFGAEGEKWHWQDGGVVEIANGKVEIKLHDLTGFEGRCDAILLTSDLALTPPDEAPAAWRRTLLGIPEKPQLKGDYDLVVVGGGFAGMTAAISAGRLGLHVALIHNRPVTGGNASSEVGVGLAGEFCFDPYPRVGLMTREISWGYGKDPKWRFHKATDAAAYQLSAMKDAKVDLFINSHVNQVFMKDGRMEGVAAVNIVDSNVIRVNGKWFADTTGDGNLGFLAGADYDQSAVHMGATNLWNIGDTHQPTKFPECPWAIDLSEKSFPGRQGEHKSPNNRFNGLWGWYWESGFERDQITEAEQIRDNNFRAMYGAFDALKNVDKLYPTHWLSASYYMAGKRESRRLMGDVILSTQDLKSSKKFEDGVVPCTWDLDVHVANPLFTDKVGHKQGFTEWPFISDAPMGENTLYHHKPYWLPFRCLYSRNIPNLFMAGRDISVTHEALGAARVQTTTGMMGEVVGMAASICKKYGTDPRGVYEKHLKDLQALMEKGTGQLPAVALTAYDPFDAASGKSVAVGWKGAWKPIKGAGLGIAKESLGYAAGSPLTAVGGSLQEPTGGVSDERLLEKPFTLSSGYFYISFLAKRDAHGQFSLETSDGKSIRLAVAVASDGTVSALGATAKAASSPGLFKADTLYQVVVKFSNSGGTKGAVASVKLFDVAKDKTPASPNTIQWDVVTPGAGTGSGQDRVILSVPKGTVMLDELRIGANWDSVMSSTP